MSRSKPDFANVIPNACESSLSDQQNSFNFISFFSLGIFIIQFSNGKPTSFLMLTSSSSNPHE